MMEELLTAAGRLESALDDLLDGDHEPSLIGFADWAWYRFATARTLIRDGGSGTAAACLARGLLEEAAYWDLEDGDRCGPVLDGWPRDR